MNNIEKLEHLVSFASEKSPFYKNLYANIDLQNFSLGDLPIVDQEKFWEANTLRDNKLLTAPLEDGIVLKSGGTTGNPKFSIYSKSEWESFTRIFGEGLDHANLSQGDKVANLFYSGELYASFIFIMKSLEYAKTPIIHYPITGKCALTILIDLIKDLDINVLAGVPTSFMHLASQVMERKINLGIKKILYGGESLYKDQQEMLERCFPKATISSIGYASVDGGHLGYVDKTCVHGEHISFNDYAIMEIIDEETSEPICECGEVGTLVYTNLERTLMPIIRYPVGDRAEWIEVGHKFKLQGRSEVGARVGPVTVNRDDFLNIIKQYNKNHLVIGFQLIIEHSKGLDYLVWRIAVDNKYSVDIVADIGLIHDLFVQEKKMYQESVSMGLIGDMQIEICNYEGLIKNRRTGKLRNVIDRRG